MPDITATPTGQAILEAATQRRVGAPVYLRYAAEVGSGGDLIGATAAVLAG